MAECTKGIERTITFHADSRIDLSVFLPSSLGIHIVISLKRQFPITSALTAIILSSGSYLFHVQALTRDVSVYRDQPDKSKSQISLAQSITDPYGPKLLTIFHKTMILILLQNGITKVEY